jgi:hypothetical protein
VCRCNLFAPRSRGGLSIEHIGIEVAGLLCRERAEVRREDRRRKRDAEEAAAKAAKDKERKVTDAKPSGESTLSSM